MDCELNLIENDNYLVPLLRACTKDELNFLVDLIKNRISEELTSTHIYLKHFPDHTKYSDEISAEIQNFAGNTIFNMLTGEGVVYQKIILKVAKKLKIDDYKDLSVEDIETKILTMILETAYDNADESTKKEMINSLEGYSGEFKDYTKYSKQAFMSMIQFAIKIGGFKSYQLAMIVVNGISKQLFGKGLTLIANASISRAISIFAGPIGWAFSIIWTLFDIAGPAYRIIIPAVIYISYLRLKFKNQKRGFILIGKSGHGKSSLLNCLANEEIAEVSHIRPMTPEAKIYNIDSFNEKYPLKIIDTRGIFESTKPNDKLSDDSIQVLRNSMVRENPGVIMHIIAAKEVRAASEDIKIFKELINDIKETMRSDTHRIFVITKVDHIIKPRQFPSQEHLMKIKELMDYFCEDILNEYKQPINIGFPENGYELISQNSLYQAVIPVQSLTLEKNWNIHTLSLYLENLVENSNLFD